MPNSDIFILLKRQFLVKGRLENHHSVPIFAICAKIYNSGKYLTIKTEMKTSWLIM